MTDSIEVKDHNSKIIHLIPSHLQEPVALIAKIKGFESIDDYIVQLIKDELESIMDGGEKVVEFGNFIADYLERIIPSPSSPSSSDNSPHHQHQFPKQETPSSSSSSSESTE